MTDRDLLPEVERARPVTEAAGAVLGNGPGRSTLATQRAAFLNAASSAAAGPGVRFPRWSWILLPAVLGLVAAMLLFLRAPAETASYEGRDLRAGAVVRSAPSAEGLLKLSDGSSVKLAPETSLEVTEVSASRARLVLRGGRVSAKVRKSPDRVFSIHAGAYEVRVVGTIFSVEVRGEHVRVRVDEGKVLVRGGPLPRAGTLLGPGQVFDTQPPPAAHAPVSGGEAPAPGVATARAQPLPAPPAGAAPPSWNELSRSGRYREALLLAERLGFEKLTQTLGDDDLLLLANTARFAGDAARAKLAFGSLRSRFPGRPVAGLSALYLARVAESHDHDPAAAVRWLRTFLAEAPRSEMAPGARASLIDIALKQGKRAEARKAAAEYLAHHPKGPHAGQARALLEPARE